MLTAPAIRPPDLSVTWYRETTQLAEGAPSWLQTTAEIGTEAGLAVFALLMLAAWWRSRRGDHRADALAACPAPGDWSLPSNHASIAGAAAVALVLAWRRLAYVAVPAALLLAFSRVVVGVHYPHDVLAGLLLGAAVATVLALATGRPLAALVARLRAHPVLRSVLTARP